MESPDEYMRKEQQETVSSAKRFGIDVVETVWPGASHGAIAQRARSYRRMVVWLVTNADLRQMDPPSDEP